MYKWPSFPISGLEYQEIYCFKVTIYFYTSTTYLKVTPLPFFFIFNPVHTKNIILIMKTPILLLLVTLLGIQTSQAQFLKKLGKRAQQAAENTVIRKTSNKVAEKTSKTMDKVFDVKMTPGNTNADLSLLPDSYSFTWIYTLTTTHKKGDISIDYYLKENEDFFGFKPEINDQKALGNMIMIMDQKIDMNIILIEQNGTKTGTAMDIGNFSESLEDPENDVSDYQFTELSSKEILGYNCLGYQMENDEYHIKMYVMPDAPVTLPNNMAGNQKNLPKGFDPKLLKKAENSIMMQMDFTDKKKKKNNITIRCTSLEKKTMNFNISEYSFAFQKAMNDSSRN